MHRLVEAVLPARMGTPFRWLVGSSSVSNLGDGIGARGRTAADRLADPRPVLVARPACSGGCRGCCSASTPGAGRPDRPPDARRRGRPAARRRCSPSSRPLVTGHVNVPSSWWRCSCRDRRDLRRHGHRHAAADGRGEGGPRHRQRPADGRRADDEPAGRTGRRRVVVRGRYGDGRSWRSRSVWHWARSWCRGWASAAVERRVKRSHLGRDILEGLQWTWGNRTVRTLTLTIVTFNITYGAAWSVLVLYATERLGLGALGFGLLTSVRRRGAASSAPRATTGSSATPASRTSCASACIIETFTHLGLALTTTGLGGHGDHVRLRRPRVRLGDDRRAPSACARCRWTSRAAWAASTRSPSSEASSRARLVGGVIASLWGITAPFWFAFVGSAILLALIWPQLGHIAHAGEPSGAEPA